MTEPSEGKAELIAEQDGLLKVNTDILAELIDKDEIMFATLHNDQVVRTGERLQVHA